MLVSFDRRSCKPLTHAAEISAINSTPDFSASFTCQLHLAQTKTGTDLWCWY